MAKKVTLAVIAEQLGVSKITVSRALKEQGGVSDAIREEICNLASRLGYKYSRLRNVEMKRRFIFITPKRFFLANESFYHIIYYELNIICLASGGELFVHILDQDAEITGSLPKDIAQVSGIFVGGEINGKSLNAISSLGIPWVVIDYNMTSHMTNCVIIDNFLAGILATEYLINRGYRKIGFVGSYSQSSNVADRICGFLKVIRQKNLYFQDDWIIDNYNKTTAHYILDIQLPDKLPEALVCNCDLAAYYIIEKLKSIGLQVPADMGIISIDNTELASSCVPPLTSIDIDKRLFAKEAFRLMHERLDGRTETGHCYIDTKIVERESAPIRQI
ncbi:MAG: LacI family DNA-binding transcriptional regulator [Treponema sp.]|jgi:LacI family transcriptional regulator|nr:LacI family DNA-binding transcriptional regulator [Treponema sp.]